MLNFFIDLDKKVQEGVAKYLNRIALEENIPIDNIGIMIRQKDGVSKAHLYNDTKFIRSVPVTEIISFFNE